MTRRVAVALLLGFGGGLLFDLVGPAVRPADSRVPAAGAVLREVGGATVRVSARSCARTVVGSGFFVGGLVVTNSHVVGASRRFTVDQPSQVGAAGSMVVDVVGNRLDLDLAFGRVVGGAPPAVYQTPGSAALDAATRDTGARDPGTLGPGALKTAAADAAIGDEVLLVGYGGGRRLSSIEAVISNRVIGRPYGSAGPVLLIDAATTVGFSGGPVVNRRGEVVGVLRAYDRATGLTVAVPVSVLDEAARRSPMHRDDVSC